MECEREMGIDLSDATSDEVHPLGGIQVPRIGPKKRTYECTYCKRGFTNAQALGGHMNIHRKDRARAKQVSPTRNPDMNLVDDETSGLFPLWGARTNYRMFLQPHASLGCNFHENDNRFVEKRSCSLSLSNRSEILGSNLSLRIGSSTLMDEYEFNRGVLKDHDDLDLELRLGHDP